MCNPVSFADAYKDKLLELGHPCYEIRCQLNGDLSVTAKLYAQLEMSGRKSKVCVGSLTGRMNTKFTVKPLVLFYITLMDMPAHLGK